MKDLLKDSRGGRVTMAATTTVGGCGTMVSADSAQDCLNQLSRLETLSEMLTNIARD